MRSKNNSVGIEIGGTKMAVAAVDSHGSIIALTAIPTEAEKGFSRAVERLRHAVDQVIAEARWARESLAGIGIGCAGPVDPIRGLINIPFTLKEWDHCDIVTPLQAHFNTPVFLENDADAALLGECWIGAGSTLEPVVMLTFGTGVGGAAMIDTKLLRGSNGEHPEIGHLSVASDGPRCYCGVCGCLESIASGTAIAAAGAAAGYESSRHVFKAALQREPAPLAIIERSLDAAATAAWTIFHTLVPRRLILGGGLMDEHFELFAGAMRRRLEIATQFSPGTFGIARAELGNDAGLVGAASLCLQPSVQYQ